MSTRTRAGGPTRVADTTNTTAPTAASAGHEPNVVQDQQPTHYGHNMDYDRHRTQQSSAIEHAQNHASAGEKVGRLEKNHWMIGATVVLMIVLAFALMMVLNAVAGGGAPFTR